MSDIHYHPQFGQILSNGCLRIPASGKSEDGEILDGHVEVDSDDLRYPAWLLAIQNKGNSLNQMKDQTNAAREIRRKLKKS